MKQIIVPIDFSEQAKAAMITAAGLAELHGASLLLCHAVPIPIFFRDEKELRTSLLWEKMDKDLALEFLKFREGVDALERIKWSFELVFGEPKRTLVSFIQDNNPDLVVTSTAGHNKLHEFFIGSVTRHIIGRVDSPVLTVREPYPQLKVRNLIFASNFYMEMKPVMKNLVDFNKMLGSDLFLVKVNTRQHFDPTHQIAKYIEALIEEHDIDANWYNWDADTISEGITRFASHVGADMISMGAHESKGVEYFMSKHYVLDVLSRTNLPVLTFKIEPDKVEYGQLFPN